MPRAPKQRHRRSPSAERAKPRDAMSVDRYLTYCVALRLSGCLRLSLCCDHLNSLCVSLAILADYDCSASFTGECSCSPETDNRWLFSICQPVAIRERVNVLGVAICEQITIPRTTICERVLLQLPDRPGMRSFQSWVGSTSIGLRYLQSSGMHGAQVPGR
jgi:hypothetical protein